MSTQRSTARLPRSPRSPAPQEGGGGAHHHADRLRLPHCPGARSSRDRLDSGGGLAGMVVLGYDNTLPVTMTR